VNKSFAMNFKLLEKQLDELEKHQRQWVMLLNQKVE